MTYKGLIRGISYTRVKPNIMAPQSNVRHATPSEERQKDSKGEKLREKAVKKLHGEGSNPSQLGDPISLKAETSDTNPTEREAGTARDRRATNAADADSGEGKYFTKSKM
ncbi:hypothetical protein B0I35DRAFT_478191 [Stachybotrys elegans]|uniref:Uncharacterized protein n=1 Tax=Stachybotrys elegans TaxID=80388 RepID=A0A8K0SWK8_9HYPO|nr:hypothetical protein B0I35DRAFT_478191 [Stachybotrys elegans]